MALIDLSKGKVHTEQDRDKANFYLQAFVATGTVTMVVACLLVICFVQLSTNNNNAFLMLLGSALTWMGTLLGFCFPSSIGSAKKDETASKLADTANKLADKAPPPTVDPADITPPSLIDGTVDVSSPTAPKEANNGDGNRTTPTTPSGSNLGGGSTDQSQPGSGTAEVVGPSNPNSSNQPATDTIDTTDVILPHQDGPGGEGPPAEPPSISLGEESQSGV